MDSRCLEEIARHFGMTEEYIDAAFNTNGVELVPAYFNGELAGCGALTGTELHFFVFPEYRHKLIRREYTREYLAPLLAREGRLTTRVPRGSRANERFVERLGFKKIWAASDVTHYELTELPFAQGE